MKLTQLIFINQDWDKFMILSEHNLKMYLFQMIDIYFFTLYSVNIE